MNEDKMWYNSNKQHNTDIYRYWNRLVQFQESTVDRSEAAGQPEAKDHVTITQLSDGHVAKLRKPDYLFSSEMSSGEPGSNFKYSKQDVLP